NDLGATLAFFDREHGRKWIVFDRDRINGLGEDMPVRMGHKDNRFLGMVHNPIRQTWLIVDDQSDVIPSRDIFCRHNNKLVPCDSRAKSYLFNLAARNAAANSSTVEHVRQRHVIDVLRSASNFVASLLAWN